MRWHVFRRQKDSLVCRTNDAQVTTTIVSRLQTRTNLLESANTRCRNASLCNLNLMTRLLSLLDRPCFLVQCWVKDLSSCLSMLNLQSHLCYNWKLDGLEDLLCQDTINALLHPYFYICDAHMNAKIQYLVIKTRDAQDVIVCNLWHRSLHVKITFWCCNQHQRNQYTKI